MRRHLALMQLHDGELPPEEAAELEASLSEDDRAVLAGLEQLGGVVEALQREEVSRFEGVADSVMAALEAPDADAARGAPPPSLETRREGTRARRRRSGSAAVLLGGLGLAAAAAAALWFGTPTGAGPRAASPVALSAVAPSAPSVTAVPEQEPRAELAEEDADPAATIEAVDFGNQGGSIFMVQAGAESTPVVWLVDDALGATMEPL